MNRPNPNELVYPIRNVKYGDFPLLDELIDRGKTISTKGGFDQTLNCEFIEAVSVSTGEAALDIVERAKKTGKLEPLASLVYSLIPDNTRTIGTVDIKAVLLPYHQFVDGVMEDLSQNIIFQVQITPDNVLGDTILANGTILMKSGGAYIAYRYSVRGGPADMWLSKDSLI